MVACLGFISQEYALSSFLPTGASAEIVSITATSLDVEDPEKLTSVVMNDRQVLTMVI